MLDVRVGDRVNHKMRNEGGVVEAVESDGIHVRFDHPTPKGGASIGIFDENWFRTHRGVLVKE